MLVNEINPKNEVVIEISDDKERVLHLIVTQFDLQRVLASYLQLIPTS